MADKSLYEMIDAGEERPAHVSEEDWKAAKRDYSHQMTLDNTPEWYLRGGSPEDEEFYDAMREGVSFENREAVVVALRELEAEGQHPRVVEGWTSYTLTKGGTEVYEYDNNPDGRAEFERWDANDPTRTIWSSLMAEEQNEAYEEAQWAAQKSLAVDIFEIEEDRGMDIVALTKNTSGVIEHNGSTYRIDAGEYRDDITRISKDGTEVHSEVKFLRDQYFDVIRAERAAPVSDAVLDEVFEQFADDHMRSVHGIGMGDQPSALTAEQTEAILANKEMDDFQKTLQLVEEIENGFPNQDPLFSELDDLMQAQTQVLGLPFSSSTSTAASQAAPVAAEPSNVVNLAQMMASSFKSKPAEMQQPDDKAEQVASTPAFMKPRTVDFFTKPKATEQTAAETAPKLTSESRIVRLEDRDAKPKLASDELMKQGAGVSVERKAFTLSGKEIVASYEMKGGNVVYTDYDGSKTEMSFAQARRHEIAHLAQLNANALVAINMMATDPKFTLRQGDATYSVENGFFCQRLDNGSYKKEPLARTQQRWMERGREIEAMMPAKSKVTSELAASFRSVPPPSENAKTKTVEQGMTQ